MRGKRRKDAYSRLSRLQRGKCCYCGVAMTATNSGKPSAMTVEHLRRISEGGTSRWDNLALACHECNLGRGLTDWLTYTSYRRGELAA